MHLDVLGNPTHHLSWYTTLPVGKNTVYLRVSSLAVSPGGKIRSTEQGMNPLGVSYACAHPVDVGL
jgi:hypothetical protein